MMIIEIPVFIVIFCKWSLIIGLLALCISLMVLGCAALFASRHKASDIYARSLVYYHLFIKHNAEEIKEIGLAGLCRAVNWYLEEDPRAYSRLEDMIHRAKNKVSQDNQPKNSRDYEDAKTNIPTHKRR